MLHLKQLIREIPDWPKPGILFYDITTLMKDGDGFGQVIQGLTSAVQANDVDVVIGIEARGFFFAPTVAHSLGKGFVPVRKPKKLPAAVEAVEYALEYGTDKLEIHQDAIQPGQRVLIVDDVLAAGTAAREAIALIEAAGATPHAVAIALDRQEMATEKQADGQLVDVPHSAVQYVQNTLGLQVCAIARLEDLLAYLAAQAGGASSELGQHLAAVQAYRDRYGV